MKYIELSEAIAIHEKIIEKTGGLSGYNETQIGYLASALEHIKNPTITDKITHLIFSCIKFHPYGKYNDKFAEVMEDIVVSVADDSITKDDLNQILQNFIDKNISNN